MLIRILNEWGDLNYWGTHPDEEKLVSVLGVKPIKGSFGNTYKVVNKELFFLNVIKYGIEVKYICNLS